MRLDGRHGREELGGHLAVRHSLGDERGDAALGARQLAIAARARACAPKLVLGPFHPERRPELVEDLDRRRERVSRLAALPGATFGGARDEQRSSAVQWEADLRERRRSLLGGGCGFVCSLVGEENQRATPESRRRRPAVLECCRLLLELLENTLCLVEPADRHKRLDHIREHGKPTGLSHAERLEGLRKPAELLSRSR